MIIVFAGVSTAFAQAVAGEPAQNGGGQAPWESAWTAESFGGEGGGHGPIREVFCDIAGLMEGSLGGLLASAAVVLAVGGAAFGDFTNAKSAMVVGIGGATILAGVSLYFGDMGCGGGNNAQIERANHNETTGLDPFEF